MDDNEYIRRWLEQREQPKEETSEDRPSEDKPKKSIENIISEDKTKKSKKEENFDKKYEVKNNLHLKKTQKTHIMRVL